MYAKGITILIWEDWVTKKNLKKLMSENVRGHGDGLCVKNLKSNWSQTSRFH